MERKNQRHTPSDGVLEAAGTSSEKLAQFTDSYASFNRVINSLQRQYLKLKEEYAAVNERLAETNRHLMAVSAENLAVTKILNNILGSLAAGVIAVDQNGIITHFNRAAATLLGIPVEEPVGKPYREIIPVGSPPDANALRTAESGRELEAVDKTVDLVDGTRLRLSVSTRVLRDDDGRPAGAVEVFHDVTKVKRLEQELARLNTLAALGEMAATIAHQVRNPLAGIGGFAALLRRDLAPDDPRQKTVRKIIDGVESLNRTITALLNYTRSDELNCEETDFQAFLRATCERFLYERDDLVGRMKIVVETPPDPDSAHLAVTIDPTLMRQVLFNLFTNAFEACGEGTVVTVVARRLPRQKAMRLYADRLLLGLDETVVETVVADNGPGIPEGQCEQLFSPFVTTRPGGTGLGLAVARKVMQAHGGDIYAENREYSGARFVLLLPVKIDQRTSRKAVVPGERDS